MIRHSFAAAAALMISACSMGGADKADANVALDIPEVQPGQLSEATMKDVTRILSSDEYEGRMPGSAGEEKTIALLTERFKAAGLQPGNKGSWVQEVPLVEITGKDFAPLTITGGKGAPISLNYATDWVGATYREDAKTELKDSELVFVGYGIVAPEKGWNDYANIDMKGKTAVILVNDPDFNSTGTDGPFNGKAMTYYGRWTYKYEEAARQGAAGAIIIHDTAPAAYGWNVVESSWSGPQAYAQRGENAPPLTQMNGWVQLEAGKRILAAAGQDFAALSTAAQAKGFKPVPLGLKAGTSFSNDIRKFSSHNIIGILPGKTRADEYVMHTAHWDHLGRCTPAPDGDDICNGAVDNRHRHRGAGRTGRSARQGWACRTQPGVPGRDGGGIGPAGRGLLCRQSGVPAEPDGGRHQYGCLRDERPVEGCHRGRAGQIAARRFPQRCAQN